MGDKKFAYSHYLQAGVKAVGWADKHLTQDFGGDPIPLDLGVKLPTGRGDKWRFPFQISEFTVVDTGLDGAPIGVVRWHGDGFWAFEPILEDME